MGQVQFGFIGLGPWSKSTGQSPFLLLFFISVHTLFGLFLFFFFSGLPLFLLPRVLLLLLFFSFYFLHFSSE